MQKWIYGLIVVLTWATAGLVSIGVVVLQLSKERSHSFYLWNSFNSVCVLIISVSYVSIVIKVRCGAKPQHHGAASKSKVKSALRAMRPIRPELIPVSVALSD